jgi:hypothetical protein
VHSQRIASSYQKSLYGFIASPYFIAVEIEPAIGIDPRFSRQPLRAPPRCGGFHFSSNEPPIFIFTTW